MNLKRQTKISKFMSYVLRHRPEKVGQRHGKPVVLVVRSRKMQAEGHIFYVSDNKVWLTEHVPPEFGSEWEN